MYRNQTVFGHSKIRNWDAGSTVALSHLSVLLDIEPFYVVGAYQIDGTSEWMNTTITGKGQLNMTAYSKALEVSTLVLEYDNYTITAEGYLNLSAASLTPRILGDITGTLEEFQAGESEWYFREVVHLIYLGQLPTWIPVTDYLTNFLQEAFDKTPFSDIIGSP